MRLKVNDVLYSKEYGIKLRREMKTSIVGASEG
jgi:hypothetical protein